MVAENAHGSNQYESMHCYLRNTLYDLSWTRMHAPTVARSPKIACSLHCLSCTPSQHSQVRAEFRKVCEKSSVTQRSCAAYASRALSMGSASTRTGFEVVDKG
eukprot:6195916-Pleurochrysis_carterae.AAC.1